MDLGLQGKTAVITGGSGGLCRATSPKSAKAASGIASALT
jgi:NAD(P)-dependent dehydrogenase (short-subunit alcohol dehydrogenase family)